MVQCRPVDVLGAEDGLSRLGRASLRRLSRLGQPDYACGDLLRPFRAFLPQPCDVQNLRNGMLPRQAALKRSFLTYDLDTLPDNRP
jgi:hypothetical protein